MGIYEIFRTLFTGRNRYYEEAIREEQAKRQAIADAFIARMERENKR